MGGSCGAGRRAAGRERAWRPSPGPPALCLRCGPRPRGVLGPELCGAPAPRGGRAGFRLTSLCLELAAAAPDSQANFTVSGPARGGDWRRVPDCTPGKEAEGMIGARAR